MLRSAQRFEVFFDLISRSDEEGERLPEVGFSRRLNPGRAGNSLRFFR